ncbi:helix-turn-helix domain-containing protein [Streptomyces sp. NPDC007172]|uniref:helix-turn-helix domain-containing protein n=1 Tax=Streptomyces sp. NPDC007172 TaxID=3364776 RepID=UPI0036A49970
MLVLSQSRSHSTESVSVGGAPDGCGTVQIVRSHDEELRDTTRCRRFGEISVRLVAGGPAELVRPARLIDPGCPGVLRVIRPLAGEALLWQDGRHATVRSPELICLDSSRPFKLVMPQPFRLVEAVVTHRSMGLTPADAARLTARPWCGEQGIAAFMSTLLGGFQRHGDEIETAFDLFGGSIVGLAAALFAERMRSAVAEPDAARQSLMLHIQAYVRERLADPELTPSLVAKRYNVSLRYLQKMFREHGTSPARWIRDERLARCRCELSDPRLEHLPVALIGERAGLYGASHFSRLFRDRYGVTPREFRREKATG